MDITAGTSSAELGEITESQLDTMRLLSKGLSNSEIAKLRGVTEKSIEQSIARLAKNLNLPKGKAINQRVQISRLYFKLTGSRVQSEE
jgi:DNA-binding NarL/FixJ family response regulator